MVDISWWSVAGRGAHTVTDSVHSFMTKQDAETFAIEIAKAWVDERPGAAQANTGSG
jgi:hypothetical protein